MLVSGLPRPGFEAMYMQHIIKYSKGVVSYYWDVASTINYCMATIIARFSMTNILSNTYCISVAILTTFMGQVAANSNVCNRKKHSLHAILE